jgi:hypothetical protein
MKTQLIFRYIIKRDDLTIAEANTISDIAKAIGCSRQHLYTQKRGDELKHRGITYLIIDKLNYYENSFNFSN